METQYLPIVNPDIGHSIARELHLADDAEYMDQQLERLEEENPVVSVWIKNFSERTDDPMGAKFCAYMLYRMLESQAEANRMAREIPLD
jgi:hypothetical protein